MTLSCCKKFICIAQRNSIKACGDFYCLNYLHFYRTENKLKKHENVWKNHVYCYAQMPKEGNKILKYNNGEESIKVLFIIYADLESLLEKMSTSHDNPKTSSTTKISKHTPSGYSLFTHCTFDTTKNKLDYYRGKDYIKTFCKDLKEHAARKINFEKEGNHYQLKKMNHILSKMFVIYAKKNWVLILRIAVKLCL